MKSPLTLWKSSLSALMSREAVNAIIKSEKVRLLLNYLKYGYCSDEALWGTIAGNPKGQTKFKIKDILKLKK